MTETTTKPELPAELNAIAAQGLLARLSGLTGSVYGYCTDTMRRVLSHMMRQGAIPQHVAFIMDGNRRYAKKMNVQTIQGHIQGFHKLEEVRLGCRVHRRGSLLRPPLLS